MSRENLDLARQAMDALTRRDASGLIELSHPEVEWHSFFAELAEEGGVYHGHDGARQWVSDLSDAWEEARAAVDDTLAVGDVAVLVGSLRYRSKTSGVENEMPAGWVVEFRDGRILRWRAFRDPVDALKAVGLRE